MLIGKIIGLLIFGAILTMPAHVLVGSLLAPWKVRERAVLVMAAVFAYIAVWALIFGADGPLDEAGTQRTIAAVERSKAELLADLHRSREECKALAISLSAEPQDFRNKQFSTCMDGVRAESEATAGELRALDARLAELKSPDR